MRACHLDGDEKISMTLVETQLCSANARSDRVSRTGGIKLIFDMDLEFGFGERKSMVNLCGREEANVKFLLFSTSGRRLFTSLFTRVK